MTQSENSIFWNSSSLRILSKQYNSITTQINAILFWLPIYRTRTFIWSNSPDYKNLFEKLGRQIYLHSINLGDAIKYVIPKFWFG